MEEYNYRIQDILKLNNTLIKLKCDPEANRDRIISIKKRLKSLISSVLNTNDNDTDENES
jgi:hypothetical protein